MNDIKQMKFAVIGGDIRMLYCAAALSERGAEVSFCGFDTPSGICGGAVRCGGMADAVSGADAVILPVPYSTDGCRINCPFSRTEIRADDVLSAVRPTQLLFAGLCRQAFVAAAEDRGLTLIDYMNDETLTLKNAYATAEGALQICLREMTTVLRGSDVLVLGYGRVGSMTAELFSAAGARVTVCARRREQLALAECRGHSVLDIKHIIKLSQGASVVINTVPDRVIDAGFLSLLNGDALIIDLASMPGGVDDDAASHFGVRVIHALSLPGKTAPESVGGYIADAVASFAGRLS